MTESNQVPAVVPSTSVPSTGKTKTSKEAFAYKLKSIKDMVGGLTAGSDTLKGKGFTPEFITAFGQLQQDILDMNDQRNAAKSQSIALTKNLAAKMTEMEDRYSQAKKRIKLELPREEWPKYGFYDMR